jgi:hypothetical protein
VYCGLEVGRGKSKFQSSVRTLVPTIYDWDSFVVTRAFL